MGEWLFGSEPETQQVSGMTGSQLGLLNKLSEYLKGQVGKGGPVYQGELAAGASPLQQLSFNKVLNLMGEGEQYGTTLQGILEGAKEQGGPAYQTGMQAIMNMLQPYKAEDTVGTWQKYVEPEAQRMFEKQLSPMVEQYVSKGATSSGAFNRALTGAAGDMASQMGLGLGQQIFGEKQAHEGLMPQGISQALGYYQAPFEMGTQGFGQMLNVAGLQQNLANLGLGAGGTEQNIAQNLLNAAFQKWQSGQAYANPWLQQIGMALGQQPMQAYQTPGTQGFLSPQNITQLLGGVSSGMGQTFGTGMGAQLLKSLGIM